MTAPVQISSREALRLRERFLTRANAVFYARVACLCLGAALLLVPTWRALFASDLSRGVPVYALFFVSAVASRVVAPHPRHGRWAMFLSLIVDLVVLLSLVSVSGGLNSPFMAGLVLLTIFFALLFPSPVAIVPPFLMLPLVTATASGEAGKTPLLLSVLLVSLHAVLNGVAVYVIVYLTGREEKDAREILELEAELKKLAVVEERNRLARDIHDGTGAALSGLIIQSEYLQTLAKDKPELLSEITELKSAAEEAIDEVRRALTMMRDEFELIPQLENACTNFTTRNRLPAELTVDGEVPALTDEQQLTVFRILQECLTNIAKHAAAQSVVVEVKFSDEEVTLRIRDDGKGFDPQKTPRHHYGLQNMRERARKIRGRVEIESAPGEGTEVRLFITPGGGASSAQQPM